MQFVLEPAFEELGAVHGVAALVTGIVNGEAPPELAKLKEEIAGDVVARSDEDIQSDAVLAGYRRMTAAIGRSLRKFPPAAEKLIGQVRRTGRLPTISAAVDAYNIVVLETGLALGVHDRARTGNVIRFRRSPGGELFRAVGADSVKQTQAGDYVYADDNRVLAWLDSSDCDDVKVSVETTDLLIIIQGTPETTRGYLSEAAERACTTIQKYCGGTFELRNLKELQRW